jgi:hypothetical protein
MVVSYSRTSLWPFQTRSYQVCRTIVHKIECTNPNGMSSDCLDCFYHALKHLGTYIQLSQQRTYHSNCVKHAQTHIVN